MSASPYVEDEARVVACAGAFRQADSQRLTMMVNSNHSAHLREAARRELKRRELFSAPIKERA